MPKTKIIVNDIDVSEYISDLKTSIEFEADKIIGNVPSKEMSLNADNSEGVFNDLLDYPFLMKDEEGNLKGTFYVLDKPERMTNELSLTLYDSMHLTNALYSSNLVYPTTIKNILDDYNNNLDISIDYSQLPSYVLEKEVNTYDTSEMVRTHLSWIAQLGASNIFSSEDGTLVFVPLSVETKHDLEPSDVEQFETIEDFQLSGVKFDNGIVSILSGTEENNVLFVDDENIYIDSQDDIDSIYSNIQGLNFRTCIKLKSSHIDDLKLGDIVNVANDFKIMPMSETRTYLNATYDIVEISGDLNTKDKSKVIHVPSTKTKIRRIQTFIDQDNGTFKMVSQMNDKLTEFIDDYNGFKTSASQNIDGLESHAVEVSNNPPENKDKLWMDTSVEPPKLKIWNEKIEQENKWEYINDGDLVFRRITDLEQTTNGFNFIWTDTATGEEHKDHVEGTTEKLAEIKRYIRFIDGNIVIKADGVDSALNQTPEKFFFSINNKDLSTTKYEDIREDEKPFEIDYEGRAKMNDLKIIDRMTIGNFGFFPRSNGNLSFKKIK